MGKLNHARAFHRCWRHIGDNLCSSFRDTAYTATFDGYRIGLSGNGLSDCLRRFLWRFCAKSRAHGFTPAEEIAMAQRIASQVDTLSNKSPHVVEPLWLIPLLRELQLYLDPVASVASVGMVHANESFMLESNISPGSRSIFSSISCLADSLFLRFYQSSSACKLYLYCLLLKLFIGCSCDELAGFSFSYTLSSTYWLISRTF